jgi:hypothetical protein
MTTDLQKADSILPRFDWDDDRKRKYLSYRMCGFGREEAAKFCGLKRKAIYHWLANDVAFKEVEQRTLLDLKKTFSKESIALEFTRNLRLVLEKDTKVFTKALMEPDKMTKAEEKYLLKARSMYTPQQVQSLDSTELSNMGFDEIIFLARKYDGSKKEESNGQEVFYEQTEYSTSPGKSDRDTWREEEEELPEDIEDMDDE